MKAAFIVIALLTAACSGLSAATIEWWQFWTDPAVRPTVDSLVAEFEQAHPDIRVNLTDLTWANGHEKLALAFASGSGPDVLEIGSDWIAQFAANGHLADLSTDITADSSHFHGWGMATFKGSVYAWPWILGTRVLFGNRDLLTRAGYPNDFVPVSQQQLFQAACKIDSLGKDIYGWGSNAPEKHRLYKKFLPFFWTAGAQIFSDDGRYCVISSTKAIDALRFYKQLHDSCGYVADQRGIEDAFLAGKVGFILSGDWLLKRIELEKPQFNLVSGLFPGQSFPGRSFLGGEFLAINSRSQKKAEALTFIRFLTASENQVRFCRANRSANPSSIEAQQDTYFTSNAHLQTFIKQLPLSKYPPVDPDWVYIEEAIEGAVEDALFGSGHPAEALRQARAKIASMKHCR